jgi:hypothetical protein
MVRVSRQTFELPPHLPTYQPKLVRGSLTILGSQAVQCQCSAAATVFFCLLSLRICLFAHSTEMERRESKSSNIWLQNR